MQSVARRRGNELARSLSFTWRGRQSLTTVELKSSHPADETLAAYADGRLDRRGTEEVERHLGTCEDCSAVFDLTADAMDEGVIARPAANVVRGSFGGRTAVVTLAAAAAVTVVFFTPPVQEKVAEWRSGGVTKLVAAAERLDQRPVEPWVSGFPYRRHSNPRGGGAEESPEMKALRFKGAAAEVIVDAGENPSKRELRAVGLSQLFFEERDAAIETLTKANDAAGGTDPVALNDLAAAYLERSRFSRNAQDEVMARSLVDKAWSLAKTREIAWNRGLAYRGTKQERAMWEEYLKLDSTSEAAEYVRSHYLAD